MKNFMKDKRIVACYVLHYGAEWFRHALRSIQDCVDEVVVVYSAKPSFGHTTNEKCPESEQDLKDCVEDWYNVTWYSRDSFPSEGLHRDWAYNRVRTHHNADFMLVADPDEIWETELLEKTLLWADTNMTARELRVGMQHFWRSVDWVCRDPIIPIRILNFHGVGEQYSPWCHDMLIHHFGYAQSYNIMRYKWLIHGHFYELRHGWLEDKFRKWRPALLDVHPTNKDFWHPARIDRAEIEHLIGDHPYYQLPKGTLIP